jgi:hypothetical protein
MLSATPDWRWMLERSDSPWYPTMRLFRQSEIGDWTPVVDAVALALAELTQHSIAITWADLDSRG